VAAAESENVEGIEVDFAWRAERVIGEVDGYEHHRSPSAFETDRERDVTLAMKGWTTRRFTYEQVARRGGWFAAAVRQFSDGSSGIVESSA